MNENKIKLKNLRQYCYFKKTIKKLEPEFKKIVNFS